MLSLTHPVAAAGVVAVAVLLMVIFAAWIVRAVRRRWYGRGRTQPGGPPPAGAAGGLSRPS